MNFRVAIGWSLVDGALRPPFAENENQLKVRAPRFKSGLCVIHSLYYCHVVFLLLLHFIFCLCSKDFLSLRLPLPLCPLHLFPVALPSRMICFIKLTVPSLCST